MKIAIVHSMYRSDQPSGENIAVQAQVAQLRVAGHQVLEVYADSDNILNPVLAAVKVSVGAGIDPTSRIEKFDPDLVHVHNTFPNFSSRWPLELQPPVVATLHNFRYTCASGTLFRDGKPCALCIDHRKINSVIHGCYRNSRIATIPMYTGVSKGPEGSPLILASRKIVALSARAEEIHVRAGVNKQKICLVPNFVKPSLERADPQSSRWAYVGRLSPEKGIQHLLKVWPKGRKLDIYGDGPLRSTLEGMAGSSVKFHGVIPSEHVQSRLAKARGLVFPSIWPESAYPMSYLDALSVALPVVALQGNGAADDVVAHDTGSVFAEWTDLQSAMDRVDAEWDHFSERALHRFESEFSAQKWTDKMQGVYNSAICEK
ncbi:glycosyltransferase family 4 protein [Rhodococcus sp. 077-4]|uniref:glycosyltransferase family 4 protein n=1 Tax=Rhodococcus sp. 077-4 TaxID=2789271 RepID=UPI0039F5D0A0